MKLHTAIAAFGIILPTQVLADFDMWESAVAINWCAGGVCDGNSELWIRVTQPYLPFDDAICTGNALGGTVQSPWCNRGLKFNNGCAILRNCAGNGEPQAVADGEWFADLEDCGGGNRGTCYAWHTGASAETCATGELSRLSYSRIACKTTSFFGEESLGEWFG